MKEITKSQVIGLMDSISRSGIDSSRYEIVEVHERCKSSEKIACGDGRTLEPGTYCVIYAEEPDVSDVPFVGDWVDENLTDSNVDIILGDEATVLIICLDLM